VINELTFFKGTKDLSYLPCLLLTYISDI